MENKNITNVSENTLSDVLPECDSPTNSQKGFKRFLQKLTKLSWKTWLIIAVVVAMLIGGGLSLYDRLTNTYKTPLDRYMDYMNSRSYSLNEEIAVFNGFAEAEFKLFELCNRISKDYWKEREDDFADDVKSRKATYGNNYKYSYDILDKDKLNRKELDEFKNYLQYYAVILKTIIEYTADFDSKDWENFADSSNLFVFQAKLYVLATNALYQELKDAEITEGYEIKSNFIIDGSNLDEPKEQEKTMFVYKIDGRWVISELLEIQLEHRALHWLPENMLYDIFYNMYG